MKIIIFDIYIIYIYVFGFGYLLNSSTNSVFQKDYLYFNFKNSLKLFLKEMNIIKFDNIFKFCLFILS